MAFASIILADRLFIAQLLTVRHTHVQCYTAHDVESTVPACTAVSEIYYCT